MYFVEHGNEKTVSAFENVELRHYETGVSIHKQ